MLQKLRIIWRGILPENPVFVLALGLCSTLAATAKVEYALYMSLLVGLTTIVTSLIASSLRHTIPFKFRLLSYMLIIVTAVITAEQLLKINNPDMAKTLGAYVGLIVTNCIIMGRMEAYASSHNPLEAFCDALGVSIGYTLVLISISAIREILGYGTLCNLLIMPDGYIPSKVFSSPSGAFIVFAALMFLVNWVESLVRRN